MTHAKAILDPDFALGDVDPRLFGTFVEHLGRCVYTGIYEPAHPTADRNGFRRDVLDLARQLGITIVRYPGGNFVSGYRWEDGVGPRAQRPERLDLAWRTVERNHVGTDEFIDWVRLAGAEPMLAINLGTRGVAAAAELVEYCNHPGGTQLSNWRISNGHADPHTVRVWCLGNEMDGPWQIGHKTAGDYGKLAQEAAKAMKLVDPTIELVACGSSGRDMPTFGAWEATVLEHCYSSVDYISLHAYYEQHEGDLASFLASAHDMDAFIESVVATCDHARTKARSDRRVNLSFDEWNVWYASRLDQVMGAWQEHPRLIEDIYTLADAIVVGTLLITLLRHADRVRIACLAQLVNAIAPIMTEPGGKAWRQTTFFPFALTSRYARSGTVLRMEATSESIDTRRYGKVPALEATSIWNAPTRQLVLLCANRNISKDLEMDVELRGFGALSVIEHVALTGTDPSVKNTLEDPDAVRPQAISQVRLENGRLFATLPPLSWNLVRLGPG